MDRLVDDQPGPRRDAETIEDLLAAVEDRCNRAVAVINTTAHAIGGDELSLFGEDVQRLLGTSLERNRRGVGGPALLAPAGGGGDGIVTPKLIDVRAPDRRCRQLPN